MSSPLQSLLDQLVLMHLKNNQRGASDKRCKQLAWIATPCIMSEHPDDDEHVVYIHTKGTNFAVPCPLSQAKELFQLLWLGMRCKPLVESPQAVI
jgi:hypothetical protein